VLATVVALGSEKKGRSFEKQAHTEMAGQV